MLTSPRKSSGQLNVSFKIRTAICVITAFIVFPVLSPNLLTAQNVMISNKNNPCEPAIIINPNTPNVLIAGANLNNYYISTDTGHTWQENTLKSSFGVWGDPALAVDTANNFYFFHLSNPPSGSWVDRIVCQKSSNNGSSWTDGSYTGLNGTKLQDKQWCAVDRTNNNMYVTWTQFDLYNSTDPMDSSVILFSKSTNEGKSWSKPMRISKMAGDCRDDDNTVEGAVPAVGPNGEIYVSWAGPNGLVFNKSFDYGNTWMSSELVINTIPGGWNYRVPGIFRANGLPVITCDISNSYQRGTIYINWSDQRNGSSNTDIWLVKSTDGGQSWTPPTKVNDDNSNHQQFFTWMTIDQTNGYLYFVFYDRRNYSGDSTDVFIAVSTDGGSSFENRRISESPFVPNESIFFGDYTNITAHNGIIRPIWTRLNNGQLSLWTNISSLGEIMAPKGEVSVPKDILSFESYPNPSGNYAYVSFKLHASSNVTLDVYDVSGKFIRNVIDNENRDYGKYIEKIDLTNLNIASGTYFLRLRINDDVRTVTQIFVP